MARFYLGIDGGQSSTKALIADENGRVLGVGKGGPCNHVEGPEGRAKFRSAVGACIRQACEQAGLDSETIVFASVCLGLSGGAEDKEAYGRELIRSRRYKFTNDAEIALSGATAGKPGMIVIAGTGSIVFGRNGEGRTARAGGWGYIFGDEGGAFDLVRRALRAALADEEGWGEPTALRRLLLEATQAQSVNALLHLFYTSEWPRKRVATFAPLVTEAAEAGDGVADGILQSAARDLVRYAEGVYRNLFPGREQVPAAYIGGVFLSETFRGYYRELLQQTTNCILGPPKSEPAVGALLEALRADGNYSEITAWP